MLDEPSGWIGPNRRLIRSVMCHEQESSNDIKGAPSLIINVVTGYLRRLVF